MPAPAHTPEDVPQAHAPGGLHGEFGAGLGERVCVTADPVIRVKKADPAQGLEILAREGCPRSPDRLTVGWAVKARKPDKAFLREVVAQQLGQPENKEVIEDAAAAGGVL